MRTRHATLDFARAYEASPARLWQAWTDPAARVVWAPPAPDVTVEFLEADTRTGGREVSVCRAPGMADIVAEIGWLLVEDGGRSVNTEALRQSDRLLSLALVTAEIRSRDGGAELEVTVQLTSIAGDMSDGYRQGFAAGLDNIAAYLAT